MLSNYYISNNVRILIFGFLLLGIPLQSYVVVLANYVYKDKNRRHIEKIFLITQLILCYFISNILVEMRFFGITNRYFETIIFTILFSVFFIRAVYYLPRLWRVKNNRITANSIKEAIDNLDLGLLVYDRKGIIILANKKMLDLMLRLFNDVYRNGIKFWIDINSLREDGEFSCVKMKDSVLIRSKKESWEFSLSTIRADEKIYSQLIAKNMTSRDTQIKNLEETTKTLKKANEEYENLLLNIKEMVDREEKLSMKIRLHDSLGQQFTMIQSILRSEGNEAIDYDLMKPSKIIDGIKDEDLDNPFEKTMEIVDFFNEMGISTQLSGFFPKSHIIATIFSDIIREATTNAVIHAGATILNISLSEDEYIYKLEIANNGDLPGKDIVEGGGIKGMRYRLNSVGGTLMIKSLESFLITAIVPKEEENFSNYTKFS